MLQVDVYHYAYYVAAYYRRHETYDLATRNLSLWY
jgi:hypothetical protein